MRAGALAALSVGSAVFISVFVALMGVLQALLPIWAELHGARRAAPRSAARCASRSTSALLAHRARHGAAAVSRRRCCAGPRCRRRCRPTCASYLGVLAFALPPALLFRLFSTLNQSLGKPQLVTWLQLGVAGGEGAAVDLVHLRRRRACRRWALVGCAWATLVVQLRCCSACALWLLRTEPLYRRYRIWQPHRAARLGRAARSSRGWACRPAWRCWWR